MTSSSHASPPLLQSYLRSHAGRHHDRVSARRDFRVVRGFFPCALLGPPPGPYARFARPTWGRGVGKSFVAACPLSRDQSGGSVRVLSLGHAAQRRRMTRNFPCRSLECPSDSVCPGLLSTKRDDWWRRFQNRIE